MKFRDADHGVTEHAGAEVAELKDFSFCCRLKKKIEFQRLLVVVA